MLGKSLSEINELPREELNLWAAYFELKSEKRGS